MTDLLSDLDAALDALAGLAFRDLGRAGDVLWLSFGETRTLAGDDGREHAVGSHAIHVACPWRWAAPDRVVVGSGDLLTPADPEAELDDFDWDEPGASWLDVRIDELRARLAETPVAVRRVTRDAWLGLRVELDDNSVLEAFPNSTPTGHVSTEFWRLSQPGRDVAHWVAGTFGLDREA
jgi:hypothetical protein